MNPAYSVAWSRWPRWSRCKFGFNTKKSIRGITKYSIVLHALKLFKYSEIP